MAEESNQPLLSQSQPQPHYYIDDPPIIIHRHRRLRRLCDCHCCISPLLTTSFVSLLLIISIFLLFPSSPSVSVARLRLRHLHLTVVPVPSLSLSLSLKVKIHNKDFFSLDYRSITVSIGYRGKKLGFVRSDGGRVRARGVSYVDAELDLDGIRIFSDVFYLIEDLAKGSVPLDTVTEVDGRLHVLFLDVPVDGKIYCAVNVNPKNQTVVHQDCYPE